MELNFGEPTSTSNTSTLQDPTHIYGVGGPVNVTLVVTSNNGCVDTVTQVLNVFEKPVANFNANGICLDDGTVYTDTSTVGGATIATWNWTLVILVQTLPFKIQIIISQQQVLITLC